MSSFALTCYFESRWSRDLSRDQKFKNFVLEICRWILVARIEK